MINNTVLRKLNKSKFGADISRIELFIKYFRLANEVADLRNYVEDYENLRNILKEVKPESSLFTSDDSGFVDIQNDYDFNTYNFIRNDLEVTNNTTSDNLRETLHSIINPTDLVAIPYVDGLNAKCIYLNGFIYRIYLCNRDKNYIDVTDELKTRVPGFIDEISEYEVTELLGKVTIFNNHKLEQNYLGNTCCSAMYYLHNNVHTDCLDIIFTDIIFSENKSNEINNIWDRIEYMRTLGINVVHHALLRNIDSSLLQVSMESFNSYFDEIENDTGIIYKYTGIEIRQLTDIEYEGNIRFVFNRATTNNSVYESRIKSFKTIYNDKRIVIAANIIAIKDGGVTIDNVIIDDISKIDTNGIHIGETIQFKVKEGKAYIL